MKSLRQQEKSTKQSLLVNRKVSAALDRLVLGALIQEHAGLKKPVKVGRRPRTSQFSKKLIRVAETRWGLHDPTLSQSRLVFLYCMMVICLRLASGQLWKLGLQSTIAFIKTRIATHVAQHRPVASYANTSPKEDQALRLSLLLRRMGRPSAAAQVLVDRYHSEQPSHITTKLLASWLTDTGEAKVAKHLTDKAPASDVPETVTRYKPQRLRYGVVVLTMFDTDIFRASIRSLIESDFDGTIVVVEDGNESAEQCRAFCESVGVIYVKSASWVGCAAGLNLGIEQLPEDTEIVVTSHNDVLWPPTWFGSLDRVWNDVYDTKRVSLLNLGYMQFNARLGKDFRDIFVQGRYDDLLWVLRAIRDCPDLMDDVQDVSVKPGEDPFGLARDPWVDWIPDFRQMTGRYSVAASFPLQVWREIGHFDSNLAFAFDLQFLDYNVANKRWAFFVNTPPLVHLKSSDTENLAPEKVNEASTPDFMAQTYDRFKEKYGWHIEHYLNLYFSESTVIHGDAILASANALRFSDIDFVFDDFLHRLDTRVLDNCEITWCRSRAECPYVDPMKPVPSC